MRVIIWVLLAAVALWSGYWFLGARGIEAGLTRWTEARVAEGWVGEIGTISVDGYPTRFDTTIAGVEFADPGTGVLVSAPDLRIEAASRSPTRATVIFPPEMTVASPDARVSVASDVMTAHFGFIPGPALTVDDLEVDIAGLTLTAESGWNAALETGALDLARQEGSEATYDLVFAADALQPSDPVRRRVDPAGFLPDTIEALRLTTTVTFDRAWDLRALEERRPQPREIELDLLQATWGDLELRAAGSLSVDANGVPTGQITVKSTNWREMIALAQAAGVLPESVARTVEQALGFVAGLSGNPNTLDAPLDFADGQIKFGPVPLGPAPYIYLR